ncbi:hypothetical protein [Streptomyces sp. NPDC003032]
MLVGMARRGVTFGVDVIALCGGGSSGGSEGGVLLVLGGGVLPQRRVEFADSWVRIQRQRSELRDQLAAALSGCPTLPVVDCSTLT